MTKTMRLRQLDAVYKLLDDVYFILKVLVPGSKVSIPYFVCPPVRQNPTHTSLQ